jgi:hypothetical protein
VSCTHILPIIISALQTGLINVLNDCHDEGILMIHLDFIDFVNLKLGVFFSNTYTDVDRKSCRRTFNT